MMRQKTWTKNLNRGIKRSFVALRVNELTATAKVRFASMSQHLASQIFCGLPNFAGAAPLNYSLVPTPETTCHVSG